MKQSTTYFSGGINQTKKSLDWIKEENLIIYGVHNRIVIYNPQENAVTEISEGFHGSYINCVQIIENDCSDSFYILSTSTDGTIKIWERKKHDDHQLIQSIKGIVTFEGHNGSVSCGAGLFLSHISEELKDDIFIITTGDDFCIKGWKVNISSKVSTELFNYKLPNRSLALDLLLIPNSQSKNDRHWPLVVYGGDDGKVHVLTSRNGKEFNHMASLSGHQDWVTSLSFCVQDDNIILSSGSKDGVVRLWRISSPNQEMEVNQRGLITFRMSPLYIRVWEAVASPMEDDTEQPFDLLCTLEAVLQGHDGLVSHLDWGESQDGSLELVSCSKTEDRSIIVWGATSPEDSEMATGGVWIEKARLGEVGGNREGFFCVAFGPQRAVAAASYQGGFHLWNNVEGMESSWIPQPVVSGHFDQVVDLDWDKQGRYLMTVSKDQTTRLHSQWEMETGKVIWQEVARPQVHGYDMACISCLNQFQFASGGEEKVVRGFISTKNFFTRLSDFSPLKDQISSGKIDELPESASVPSLGLSNKEADPQTLEACDHHEANFKGPPTEDELMLGTLWSEVSKLYGHGNELLALASSHDGTTLASSCRASVGADASIIIWDTVDWKEMDRLSHHRLSVTQLEFSSCDAFLLSVSRDRTWAVFRRGGTNDGWEVAAHSGNLGKENQHTRIVWSCAWVPGTLTFVTGARDKTAVVWVPVYGEGGCVTSWNRGLTLKSEEEVCAVAAERLTSNTFIVAVGCADGSVTFKIVDETREEYKSDSVQSLEHRVRMHGKTVRRLKFRPSSSSNSLLLASCGSDHSVLLQTIHYK